MILIAPDKFKGTFTASEMCKLMTEAVSSVRSGVQTVCRPLSDGGEGFAQMWHEAGRTDRIVASSDFVGLHSFPDDMPLMQRSSFALGRQIQPGQPVMITVGGTGVCDGGAGFLQALGVQFYDSANQLITLPLCPDTISSISRADVSALSAYQIRGVIDVKASLTGPGLSALDFARQKALPEEDLSRLPVALEHLRQVLGGESPFDGAGGGLGYALAGVIGAECVSGAELAVSLIEPLLDSGKVSLVITGEGCIDRQTVDGGKLPDAVFRAASLRGIATLMVYGRCEVPDAYPLMCQLNNLDICLRKLL